MLEFHPGQRDAAENPSQQMKKKTAERKRGKQKKTESASDREPQNTRRRQKSSPAVGPVEAKPKRSSRKKETQKREPKKEAAKPRTTKKDTRNRKTMSPEEAEKAEKAALKSRPDSCYHVTRRKLNKEGMCDEDAKVEARKVTRLSICANCLFEKKRKDFSMSRPPVSALYSIFDFS